MAHQRQPSSSSPQRGSRLPPTGPPRNHPPRTGHEECGDGYCEEKLSDPRVSGTAQIELGGTVTTPGGHARWGTVTLTGPDGQWIGPYVGHQIRQTTIEILGVLEGTEAHEGWTFIVEWSGPIGSPFEVKGLIYEGSAPQMRLPS